MSLLDDGKCLTICAFVFTTIWRTDSQTDRQTEMVNQYRVLHASARSDARQKSQYSAVT